METNLKKINKSQVEIDFQLDAGEFNKYIDKALEHVRKRVKMDGFRPGSVPKQIAEKQIKQESLLMEAGDLAVRESYRKFVSDNSLEIIGDPEVKVVKIAKGRSFVFKVKTDVVPEINLPDYKKIARDIKTQEISVQEKEIDDSMNFLQKSRAKISPVDRAAQNKDFVEIEYSSKDIDGGRKIQDKFILGEGGFVKSFEDNLAGMEKSQEKEFKANFPDNMPGGLGGKESIFKVKMMAVNSVDLLKMDDEFARSVGEFASVSALKKSIKDGIEMEKKEAEKQRRRDEVLSVIVKGAELEVPEKMLTYEAEKMMDNFKDQVAKTNISLEKYLGQIKKTEKEIKESMKKDAEDRIKKFLILRKIGKQENIKILPEELEAQVNKNIKNYSKEQLEKIDIIKFREYTQAIIFNEKVFQLLEQLSNKN